MFAQIFVWIDQDPEKAFDRGALLFEVAEITWDTSGLVWNSAIDVFNAGIIPLWNTAAFYVAEPLFTLFLEVFSLVFLKKSFPGVYSEEDTPYFGLDCTASLKSAQWCGALSSAREPARPGPRAAVASLATVSLRGASPRSLRLLQCAAPVGREGARFRRSVAGVRIASLVRRVL